MRNAAFLSCRHPCLQVLEPVEDYLDLIILAAHVLHLSRCDAPHDPAVGCDVIGRSQDRSCHEEQFRHRHGIPERKRWRCRDAYRFEAGDLLIRVVKQLLSIWRPTRMVWGVRTFREELILDPGGWEWLDVDRRDGSFRARVGHPIAIGRKRGVGWIRRVNGAEGRRLPVLKRERPQRYVRSFRDGEQEPVTLRRPRLGRMRFARRRPGEALRDAAIGRLPEDCEVPLAVRLKGDALAVRGPDRKTVVPSGREGLHRAPTGKVVDPDGRFLVVITRDRETLAVWRHTGPLVGPGEKSQRLYLPLSIHQPDIQEC